MAEGLGESQWLNLVKKPTNHIMAKKSCLITDANDGIGAEIAMAALAVGTSLPTQASVASWPIAQRRIALLLRCVTHLASGLGYCTLNARRRTALSALDRFYAHRALVYQWQKDRRSQIRPETPSKYDGRRRGRP